eukprot:GEMP01037365.1.p1 GENE.GEMP01037365.1~~GEMP01037365.1.p1  ORF type:complete len:518 (+),score=139.66 GEMP01037365.1:105-1658(+)
MYRLEVNIPAPKKRHDAFERALPPRAPVSTLPRGALRLLRGDIASRAHQYTTPNRPHQVRQLVPFLPMQRTCCLFLFAAPSTVTWRHLTATFLQGPKAHIARHYNRQFTQQPQSADGWDGFDFYSAVFIFRVQRDADSFYQANHGRIFPMNDSVKEDDTEGKRPYTVAANGGPCCYLTFVESITYGCSTEKIADDPTHWHQIPTCPFCLERIDGQATGVVTHPHGWLSIFAWDEVPKTNCCASCVAIACAGDILNAPSQPDADMMDNDHSMQHRSDDAAPRDGAANGSSACAACGVSEVLWVCLSCGNLGCGRYARAHAKEHAVGGSDGVCHRFCLEIESGRIWDYVGDVFVHRRLVQMAHQTGAFEVALPHPGGDAVVHENTDLADDYLSMEFDVILAAQLDYQRQIFEDRCKRAAEECQQMIADRTDAVRNAQVSLAQLQKQCDQAGKELAKAHKLLDKCERRHVNLSQEIQLLSDANRTLIQNPTAAAEVDIKEDPVVARLQKELGDLMLLLDS